MAKRRRGRGEPLEPWFWEQLTPQGQCLVWGGSVDGGGYGTINVEGRSVKAHRLAYELAVGPIPTGMCVLHSCDNPPCSNPAHLRVGDHSDNIDDAYRRHRRRRPKGSLNGRAVLTDADTESIRKTYAAGGVRQADLASRFGVSQSRVSAIIRGEP